MSIQTECGVNFDTADLSVAPTVPDPRRHPLEKLALLRAPFPPHQICKLPKPTCSMDEYRRLTKTSCKECGGWHPATKTIHLYYVGHAAATDRLLDADPFWYWEPLAIGNDGLPMFDSDGGLWIKLTVCGMTRMGYGNAKGSTYQNPGDRIKEVIGDAIRNALMRFGGALDLWHKGELHVPEQPADAPEVGGAPGASAEDQSWLDDGDNDTPGCNQQTSSADWECDQEPVKGLTELFHSARTVDDVRGYWALVKRDHRAFYAPIKDLMKSQLQSR